MITFSYPHTTTIPLTMLSIGEEIAYGFEAFRYMNMLNGVALLIVKIGFIFPNESSNVGLLSS